MTIQSSLLIRYPNGRSEFRQPCDEAYSVGDGFKKMGVSYAVTHVDRNDDAKVELTLAYAHHAAPARRLPPAA
jgi:hypothetical protein